MIPQRQWAESHTRVHCSF